MLGIVGLCRFQMKSSRLAIPAIASVAVTFACNSDPLPPTFEQSDPPAAPIVSNAMDDAESFGLARTASATSSAGQLVYVSLAAGSVPEGRQATVQRVGSEESVVTPIIDGGFDPVAIIAAQTDSIVVIVRNALGATVLESRAPVPARRPPTIVRTSPPRKKADVPLNAIITIVFSEPVSPAAIEASAVRVMRGATPVAGTARVVEGNGSTVHFVPSEALAPNTDYAIVVGASVSDLEGDLLGLETVIEFTTGTDSVGDATSITISPEYLVTSGKSYQLSATVRDARGNDVSNPTVVWSVVPSGGLPGVEVTATGRVTPLDVGTYSVVASVNALADTATVTVYGIDPVSLTLSADNVSIAEGDTVRVTAVARSSAGQALSCASLSWTTDDPSVAKTTADRSFCNEDGVFVGAVWAFAVGTTRVIAAVRDAPIADTIVVTVEPGRPIASVSLVPGFSAMVPGSQRLVRAITRDNEGRSFFWRRLTWHSADSTVAVVDNDGVVTAQGEGIARIVASGGTAADTTSIQVRAVSYASVSMGWDHSCALTATGEAWCWGANDAAQLGDGTQFRGPATTDHATLDLGADSTRPWGASRWPIPVQTEVRFAVISAGGTHTCGIALSGDLYCWGAPIGEYSDRRELVPKKIEVEQRFVALYSSGVGPEMGTHDVICGLTSDGTAYCWGMNRWSQLGNGTSGDQSKPTRVGGGHTFSSLAVARMHVCGVVTTGEAYCWGVNGALLGAGAGTPAEPEPARTPLAVAGNLRFTQISAGGGHSCGIANDGRLYCWGASTNGELGDGSARGQRNVPGLVSSQLTFVAVASGEVHNCALSTSGVVHCWGQGGKLGMGTFEGPEQCGGSNINGLDVRTDCSTVPVRIASDETFRSLVAGSFSTCGITHTGRTYCWGGHWAASGTGMLETPIGPSRVVGQP